MPTWSFETGNPPFLEDKSPAPSTTGVSVDTLISVSVVDAESYVRTDRIDAYVEGNLAFSGGVWPATGTFFAPYNGGSSDFNLLVGGSTDGYDAYQIIIDKTADYPNLTSISVRVTADDYGFNSLDETWNFTTEGVLVSDPPFVEQQVPQPDDAVRPLDQVVSFVITDADSYVDITTVRVYAEGSLAYRGDTETFFSPFESSTFLATTSLDGYDGYEVTLTRTSDWDYNQVVNLQTTADDGYGFSMDESWSFATVSAPVFLESHDPAISSTGNAVNTDISVFIVDPDGYILTSTLDAYVEGALAYDGLTDTFYPPFVGSPPVQFLPGGSLGGYDAYQLILDRTGDFAYGDTITVRVVVDSYGGRTSLLSVDDYSLIDESWDFSLTAFDTDGPVVLNKFPAPGSSDVDAGTLVSFDVVDDKTTVIPNTILVTIGGLPALSSSSFLVPFTGASSALTPTSVSGADGYNVVIDNVGSYSGTVPVSVYAEDAYGNSVNSVWTFQTGDQINVLYFSDGYGLKAIDVGALAGESQSQVRTVLDISTSPALSSNNVQFIHGNRVTDGYNYLALSFNANVGVDVIKQESEINTYMDGYRALKAHMTEDGTLYAVNTDDNQVEVYYGANFRPGTGRTPDYVYNTTSTPPLFGGTILDLHVVDGFSSVLSGGTRFYVGTTLGATKVDTYDKNVDGYGQSMDGYGISKTYSIEGGGAEYEVIGGTVARCVEVASDDENLVMIVGTDDGAENGGVTQVSLSGNRKILFMNKEGGYIPSNTINDIFGKAY